MPNSELNQQCVLTLRPEDQFMVMQNGQQKLMLVSAFADALKAVMAGVATDTMSSMAVPAHTHAEADVTNLAADILALIVAVNSKAAASHSHQIGDILSNLQDATAFPPTPYNGCYPVIAKATVSGGNAVFQFTQNGAAGGAAIFGSGPIQNSETFRAEEGTNPHAFGVATWSNGNKTLTVSVNKTGTAVTVLGLSVLGANVAANGSVVYAIVWGR